MKTHKLKPGAAIHHLGRELREVRIMAIAEGYAMVRRNGMMPYIAAVKELSQPTGRSARASND